MESGDTIDPTQYPGMLITERDPNLSFIDEKPDQVDSIGKFRYKMTNKNRGIALIINNVEFKMKSKRVGSDNDMQCMKEALEKLKFEVTIEKNLPADKMEKAFEDIGKKDHSENDCFVAVILTHGGDNGVLYGSDDKGITVTDLMKYLLPRKCPSLIEKPKLLFVQACRGLKFDGGKVVPNPGESKPEENRIKISSWPDVLIHYSTIGGFYSWRNPSTGSVFVQTLGDIMKNHYQNKELTELLTEVNCKVAYKFKSKAKVVEMHGKMQMPIFSSSLTRKLYFL